MTKTVFKKTLGIFDAVAIVTGSMIGSGIFIVSADIAKQVNSTLLLIIVWIIAGIMTVFGALSYGELAAAIPETGGQYAYLKKIWGNLVGFLYGWTLFLVIQSGCIAAVAVAFAKFSGILFPFFDSSHFILNYGFLKFTTQQALAVSLIAVLSAVNTRGVKYGVIIQNVFTSAKIIALFGIIICGVFVGLRPEVLHLNISGFWTLPHTG